MVFNFVKALLIKKTSVLSNYLYEEQISYESIFIIKWSDGHSDWN